MEEGRAVEVAHAVKRTDAPDAREAAGQAGFDPVRLEVVFEFFKRRVDAGSVRAVSLALAHPGKPALRWAYGAKNEREPVGPDTRFLVASLSKPVTAAAVMLLVERGEITLGTPVSSVLPEFSGGGREAVQLLHLLTHTSGLPDMVTENVALRAAHAPLSEFFKAVCRTELLFAPGERVSYQSMGFVVMSTLVERLTGMPFAEFVRQELFLPAGMKESHFGLPPEDDGAGDAQVELPADQQDVDYHWNSRYWRQLGAPWGGLTTTTADLLRFLSLFVERRVLSPATVEAMTRDWLSDVDPSFPPWGLGWKLKGGAKWSAWPQPGAPAPAAAAGPGASFVSPGAAYSRGFFGDLTSSDTFGHAGATGCAMWVDPRTSLACVVLTSTPGVLRDGTMARVANLVKAAERV